METYGIFGGRLRSEVPFPDLPVCPGGACNWTFRVGGELPELDEGVVLGERELAPGWTLRLSELESGWRFHFGPTGAYDLSEDGQTITWFPGNIRDPMIVRSVVLGPVIALSLRTRGFLTLHASAVSTPDGVVGFMAPKFHGKSTLALALVLAGARLVTDDLLAVRPEAFPEALPGVPNIRLRPDTYALLKQELPGTVVEGVRPTVAHLPPDSVEEASSRVAALYVLDPSLGEAGPDPCSREPLRTVEAVVCLAYHEKLAFPLTGAAYGADTLRYAANLASSISIYQLRTARAFDRVPEMAERILAWHGGPFSYLDPAPADAAGGGLPVAGARQ